jgi:fermentation-respiration switch protein FrsA (DUF1100 family)
MYRSMLTCLILLTSVVIWWLLGRWVPGESERFYLLVPPVFLVLFRIRSPAGWSGLKPHLSLGVRYVAILFLCVILYSGFMLLSFHDFSVSSPDVFWKWAAEVFVGVYFLLAVSLVLMMVLFLLRQLTHVVDRLLCGPLPAEERKWPPRRARWLDLLPLTLLVPVALPYLIATMYIHRIKLPNAEPERLLGDRTYEAAEFRTVDGLTLRGWFIPANDNTVDRTLLICHGLAINRSPTLYHLPVADAMNAHVLTFDFRGHGDSDGHTITLGHGETLDVLAAVDYLRSRRPEQCRELFGLGISMGTSGLILAAAEVEPPFQGLIIDSGYASAVELTDYVVGNFPSVVRPFLTGPGVPLASLEAGCWLPAVRPIDRIGHVRAPVLFIHARGDGVIPVTHGQRLYEQAIEPKELWIAETEQHSAAFAAAPSEYLRRVRQLVDGRLAAR